MNEYSWAELRTRLQTISLTIYGGGFVYWRSTDGINPDEYNDFHRVWTLQNIWLLTSPHQFRRITLHSYASYPIFTFPAAHVIDSMGTNFGIKIGCILGMLGMIMRLFVNHGFWTILLGQIIAGMGRPFIMFHASKRVD